MGTMLAQYVLTAALALQAAAAALKQSRSDRHVASRGVVDGLEFVTIFGR